MLGETMSINKLFAVLDCQPTTPNRLRGEARNGRRAIYVDRSRRPDGDLRDKPGCVPASGCTKGAPWRATRCIGPDGSPVGGAQQRRLSPYLVSQEEKPSKSARGAGPPGKAKARSGVKPTCDPKFPKAPPRCLFTPYLRWIWPIKIWADKLSSAAPPPELERSLPLW